MGLPGWYNDNAARAYPLVPFSNVAETPPPRPAARRLLEPPTGDPAGRWVVTAGGHSGSHLRSDGGSPAGTATWRFPVAVGRDYRVAATWPAYLGEATGVRHTVAAADDAGAETPLLDGRLDQTAAPAGLAGYDDAWTTLGTFTAAGVELVVRVHDDAPGAMADALWVEDVTVDAPGAPVEIRPPLDTLVDFGCLVGVGSGYDDARHSVYLHEIRRAGPTFTFAFRSDAPGLRAYTLAFARDLDDPEYATDWAEAVRDDDEPDRCPAEAPIWEGFLVTGPLEGLAGLLPGDGALTATTGAQVEPCLVQNLEDGHVRAIHLANQDRTRATPPAGCPGADDPTEPPADPAAPPAAVVQARCLVGDLRFKEGFNLSIRQSTRDGSLTFGARVGAGAGEPCAEVPLAPDEAPPPGSTLLGGGPACAETVTGLNGLSARVIRLEPGHGVTIAPARDDPHTLIVDFDMHDLTACGTVEEVFEELPDV